MSGQENRPTSSSQNGKGKTKGDTLDDVERLRGPTENDWSFECRREFITYHLQHSSSAPLSVLNCYSWTLINSRTLGCRYNAEHMAALNAMAAQAGIQELLLQGAPTPKIAPPNSDDSRGKGRGKGKHHHQVPVNEVKTPRVLPSGQHHQNGGGKAPLQEKNVSNANVTTGGMNFNEFVAVLESFSPARTPAAHSQHPAEVRPFFASSEARDTNSDLDKEVEELTSILERNEKDKLLAADDHFDSSMLSVPAPLGGLILRSSEASAEIKAVMSQKTFSEKPSAPVPAAFVKRLAVLEIAPTKSAISPVLDDLELKRICDIVGPEVAETPPVCVSEFPDRDNQARPPGNVIASQETLKSMKERAPRNVFLAGLLSQIHISEPKPLSSDLEQLNPNLIKKPENSSAAARQSQHVLEPAKLSPPEPKNAEVGSRDRFPTTEILAFKERVPRANRDIISSSVVKVSKYYPDGGLVMTDFVVDSAFLDAIKFLKSRPANEIIVRLNGNLTHTDAARSLQETIDANRLSNLLAFHPESPKSASDYHRCKFVYARTVILCCDGTTPKEAKNAVALKALHALRQRFITVKIHASESAFTQPVSRTDLLGGTSTDLILDQVAAAVLSHDQICVKESFGRKLLMKFGWCDGKGLGKKETGLTQPIAYSSGMTSYSSYGKRGLGYQDEGIEKYLINDQSEKLFQCFIANAVMLRDLVFSNEFSPEEREVIHNAAEKYKLSHNSLGSGENRHLVVRYKFDLPQLVSELRRVGGSAGRYELVEPENLV